MNWSIKRKHTSAARKEPSRSSLDSNKTAETDISIKGSSLHFINKNILCDLKTKVYNMLGATTLICHFEDRTCGPCFGLAVWF